MDWTDLAQDRDMWQAIAKHGETLGLIKCGEFVG